MPGARGFVYSVVRRPALPQEREGWLYTTSVLGLADAFGAAAAITWPDEVHRDGQRVGAVGVHAEPGPRGVDWAVVNVLVEDAEPPRAPFLARTVAAIEARATADEEGVLADYRPRCATLGRRVRARLVPLGSTGERIEGVAVDALADGALVLLTDDGRRLAVRPQSLGLLDDLP